MRGFRLPLQHTNRGEVLANVKFRPVWRLAKHGAFRRCVESAEDEWWLACRAIRTEQSKALAMLDAKLDVHDGRSYCVGIDLASQGSTRSVSNEALSATRARSSCYIRGSPLSGPFMHELKSISIFSGAQNDFLRKKSGSSLTRGPPVGRCRRRARLEWERRRGRASESERERSSELDEDGTRQGEYKSKMTKTTYVKQKSKNRIHMALDTEAVHADPDVAHGEAYTVGTEASPAAAARICKAFIKAYMGIRPARITSARPLPSTWIALSVRMNASVEQPE